MEHHVYQTLQSDHDSRSVQVLADDIDLFPISALDPQEWDYSLPTLATSGSNKLIKTLKEFVDKFYDAVPFRVDMSNIIVAGGAISAILTANKSIKDIDVFIYGLSPDAATIRVNEFIHDLFEAYRAHLIAKHACDVKKSNDMRPYAPNVDFKCIRNNNCVTIIFDNGPYVFQIILRIYRNKSEILHGFDIGSSAVGFDGQSLYFTSLSKFSYEHFCNILDTTRRSTTYETRLIKYFKRGFEIILPHMNMANIDTLNNKYGLDAICELPFMVFSYNSVRGNKIRVRNFFNVGDVKKSDYQVTDLDQYQIFYINLHNMVWSKGDFYFYEESDAGDAIDVSRMIPFITRRKIIDYYDDFAKKLKAGGDINVRLLKKYMRNTIEIVRIMIGGEEDDKRTAECAALLATRIQEEKARILAISDQIVAQPHPLRWVTTNPGTQITSSFNPIIEDAHIWYGSRYIEVAPPSSSLSFRDVADASLAQTAGREARATCCHNGAESNPPAIDQGKDSDDAGSRSDGDDGDDENE